MAKSDGDACDGGAPISFAQVLEQEKRVLGKSENLTALCLSGGGIRSATFNLGVLQALAAKKLLGSFDYLSTVSGGGYIGSWLTGLLHRSHEGIDVVQQALAKDNPKPVEHLRRYGRYLSPKLGLLSADAWALAATYLRNLTLNWLVLVPLVTGLLLLPRLVIAGHRQLRSSAWRSDADLLGLEAPQWVAVLGSVLVAWSFGYAGTHQPSARRVERRDPGAAKRRDAPGSQLKFLLWCWLPLLVGAYAVTMAGSPWQRLTQERVLALVLSGMALGCIGWVGLVIRSRDLRGGVELPLVLLSGVCAGLVLAGEIWLFQAIVERPPNPWSAPLFSWLATPAVLCALSVGGTIYVGLVSRTPRSSDSDREWWARFGAWVMIAMCGWLAICGLVFLAPPLVFWLRGEAQGYVDAGVPVATALTGLVTARLGMQPDAPRGAGLGDPPPLWKRIVMPFAALAFVACFVLACTILGGCLIRLCVQGGRAIDATTALELLNGRVLLPAAAWSAALVAFAILMSFAIHLNKFSLHAIYRDRLIRAYLGASHPRRAPDPFTGFDAEDNLWMYRLREELRALTQGDGARGLVAGMAEADRNPNANKKAKGLVHALPSKLRERVLAASAAAATDAGLDVGLAEELAVQILDELGRQGLLASYEALGLVVPALLQTPKSARLLHVVNMTLNLVNSDDNAWQDRKADSFTATMLHCGNARLGYRDSRCYAGKDGITLGTAATISGAAVSPNMGYQSSPLHALLLTLLNVRLGAWFGNPGTGGNKTFRHEAPKIGLLSLLEEAFGLTDDRHGYVYLSDGGHFENLGLYEMVRRGCKTIVVSDAGCDPACAFEDLANAIRKIRIDLGIGIEFAGGVRIPARGPTPEPQSLHFAVGRIAYPDGEHGRLVYLKASFHDGCEPVDVRNYARLYSAFPHETTADQFFSEAQFESYRALGLCIAQRAFGAATTLDAAVANAASMCEGVLEIPRRQAEPAVPPEIAPQGAQASQPGA